MDSATAAATTPARRRERRRVKDVFDIDAPDTAMVEVYLDRTEYVPAIDETYVFDQKQVKKVLQWLSGNFKKNLLLTGPTGCGKSSIVEQVAGRLGVEVFRVACHGKLEFPEILGSTQLVTANAGHTEEDGLLKKAAGAIKALFKGADDGESLLQFVKRVVSGGVVTKYVYGPAINAATRFDGGILLLDEGNFLHPSTFGALNTVLDNGPLLVAETGEIVWPKPSFRIAVTGNAMDGGDDMALHKGVQRMNVALMNRFLVMRCDYMPAIQEGKVLGRTVKLPGHVISAMIATANETREAFKNAVIETTISTRTLVTWAKLVMADPKMLELKPAELLADTLSFALLDGANIVDADAIRTNLSKSIETNPPPAIPSPPGQQPSATSATFSVDVLVSANNGSPKIWGMHRAAGGNDENVFWGSLTGSLQFESKTLGYFNKTKPAKLNPPGGKPPYLEIKRFDSSDPAADLQTLQESYKRLMNGSSVKALTKHRIILGELLQAIGRSELVKLLVSI